MRQIIVGALLLIAGIAAFIEAHSHRPTRACAERGGECANIVAAGWSRTAYDLVRIGGWALVIVGGLVVVTGLIHYWAAQARQ